jgi:hypothetical protein
MVLVSVLPINPVKFIGILTFNKTIDLHFEPKP